MLLANEIIVPIKLVLNDIRRDKPIVATILCEFATGTHVYHEAIPWQYTVYTVNASQKANRVTGLISLVTPDFRIKSVLRFKLFKL